MNAWLQGLAARERRLLIAGAGIAAVALAFVLIVEPLQQRAARARAQYAAQAGELAWLRSAAAQIGGAASAAGPAATDPQARLAAIDASLAGAGIRERLERIAPEAGAAVRFGFAAVPFDALMRWLAEIHAGTGLSASALSVERLETPGEVRASGVLAPPGR
ncbi:MAG: type II secretion system protein GspM [Gammaproteobacteria bacterium]